MILGLCFLSACDRDKKGMPGKSAVGTVAEGSVAPDFSARALDGKEVRLSSLKGKVVMVNFWATWCPPCKEEIPSMMRLARLMEGKPFQMLAISIDEGGRSAVENYFTSSGNSLPAYLDGDGSIAKSYGITGVPETFIVDKSGVVQKKIVGGLDWSGSDAVAYLNELMGK